MSALLSSLRDATGYADAPLPPPALGTCDDAEAAAAAAAAAPSPWTEGCLRLEDACVDNGGILLYSKRDRSREPFEVQPSEDRIKYDGRTLQVPIRVRGALEGPPTVEGAAYLRAPAFSRCTVPVVWYSMWPVNFAHAFRDNAAKIFGVLNEHTPWAAHLKLVLVTGGGQAAPRTNHLLYQPLLQQRVETWADFSARLASAPAPDGSGYVPVGWPRVEPADEFESGMAAIGGAAPLSWEGGPQRCFKQMFVCARGLNITSWPLHGLGQHLAKHYRQEVAAAAADMQQRRQEQQQQQQPAAEVGSGGGGDDAAKGERVLKIVFHKRGSPDRQLLNAAELLQRCNAWRHTTKGGQRLRARCWEAEMSGLFEGLAAAQEADIFVAVHGANQANTWLMRPGGAMIEIQPWGFDHGPAHTQYPLFAHDDAETKVQWWMISVCDPALSTPGVHERRGAHEPVGWAKNRNLRIGWEALEQVLGTAVEVSGDMAEYRRRWDAGRWWWWLGANNRLVEVGPGRITKLHCPAELTGGADWAARLASVEGEPSESQPAKEGDDGDDR